MTCVDVVVSLKGRRLPHKGFTGPDVVDAVWAWAMANRETEARAASARVTAGLFGVITQTSMSGLVQFRVQIRARNVYLS